MIDDDGNVAGKLCDQKIDIIIGTDIVYWRDSIAPLVKTLDVLFSAHNQNLELIICYIERHHITHVELKAALEAANFVIEEIGQELTSVINKDDSSSSQPSFIYRITRKLI